MSVCERGKTSIAWVTVSFAVIILSLAMSVSGCGLGMLLPETSSVELEDPNPLKGSFANVKTIAVLTTATSGGSDAVDFSKIMSSNQVDTGSGRYSPKIAEALQGNPRFRIITPYEVEKAGGVQTQISGTMTESEKARYKAQAILNAGKSVNAEAVIIVEGKKVIGSGMSMVGRRSSGYHLTVTIYSTETGGLLWKQKAIKSVNGSAISMSDSLKAEDQELVAVIVQNFNATIK